MKPEEVQFSHNQRGTLISKLAEVQDVNCKEIYLILAAMGALLYF
jgi:hypothetical protein